MVSRFQAISTNHGEYREAFSTVDAAAKEFKSRENVSAESGSLKNLYAPQNLGTLREQ
jgi:hypothetical protein